MLRLEQQLDALSLRETWELLPLSLRVIPEQIFESTGIELEILHKAECVDPVFDIKKAIASFEIDGYQQRVVIWCDPSTATTSVIGHELLHLRRDLCEGQIKLMPTKYCHPSIALFSLQLENEMEHIFIIPEEIKLFPEAEQRWVEAYGDLITRIIACDEPDKTETVLAWMQLRTSLPNQLELAKKFGPYIFAQSEMWARESQDFHDVARDAKNQNNKRGLLSWMMEAIHTWHPEYRDTIAYGNWQVTSAGLEFKPMGIGLLPS
ncbi:hypothetical protein [Pseudomonas sp. RIT288]|jgi:hypothetical protein|uniref:hypothetical protein n=1 Tax=Pseudomonas sp. RIT288 TaxID=1470589 RepID=UPI000451352F|nr:hypothetical protein [Pseudomonas sp. RIT288]EZP33979.1 hypothetical protein BW33_00157 [Pseudomonas sp. RIT288]